MTVAQFKITFPENHRQLDQHEEFIFVETNDGSQKIRLHEYDKFFAIPGLYEEIIANELKCQSPAFISGMLFKSMEEAGDNPSDLRILDFGAGNGMVAEQLAKKNPQQIVGIDILEKAKEAAIRDRKQFYSDYFVTDLATPPEDVWETLKSYNFNAMVSVAALGYNHIPPDSFINAFNLVRNDGWIAFNLRDKFLTDKDDSGFRNTLDWINKDFMDVKDEQTYRHRYALNGDEIFYTAIVGKKLKDISK